MRECTASQAGFTNTRGSAGEHYPSMPSTTMVEQDLCKRVELLIKRLRSGVTSARCRAARSLGKTNSVEAAAALIQALEDSDRPALRAAAAWALARLGPTARAAVPSLIAALGDRNFQV